MRFRTLSVANTSTSSGSTLNLLISITAQLSSSATVVRISVADLSVTYTDLSETDLRIIKCLLLSGARIEISDIAKEVGISEKTTTRRLNRMKEMRLLNFSLQYRPL